MYQPPATIDGDTAATITYRISDGRGGESSAVVTIDITTTLELQAPVALDDTAGPVAAGTQVQVPVLANDSDPRRPRLRTPDPLG